MNFHHVWRALPMLLLLLALAVPSSAALAQDSGSIVTIDSPADATAVAIGQDVIIRGWAGHQAGPGTGVDRVVVLDAPQAAGGVAVAEAVYGAARPDVGQLYGASMTNSGFTATFRAAGAPGNRTFWVYAHSVANDGWTNKTVTLRYTAAAAAVPAPAATTGSTVTIMDFEYRPSTMNIQVGDTVTWMNQGPAVHTATSDSGRWDTGRLNPGQSGSATFTSAGTYEYHCTIHPGMRGTIVVGGGSAITSPSSSYNQNYGYNNSRYRNQNGLYGYGNSCYGGNMYGSGYLNNQYGYGNGYGSGYYGNQFGNQNCDQYGYGGSLYGGYGGGYNGLGYNGYGLGYPYIGNQYGYNQLGTGLNNCAAQASGFNTLYFNAVTGQTYSTYAQCISATTYGSVGNCVLTGGYYYNSATGQYYSSYAQCIATVSGGIGVGNCILTGGYYYNSATGQYYTTYTQCIATSTGVSGNCILYTGGYYNTLTQQYYGTYNLCIAAGGGTGNCQLVGNVYFNSTTGTYYATYNECITGATSTVQPPTGPTVGTRTQNSVILSWTPSSTGGITNYVVQQSTTGLAGSFTNSAVSNTTVTGTTVTGLAANTTYYFQVIAYQGSNPSTPAIFQATTTLP